jgi:hypothetical protein
MVAQPLVLNTNVLDTGQLAADAVAEQMQLLMPPGPPLPKAVLLLPQCCYCYCSGILSQANLRAVRE